MKPLQNITSILLFASLFSCNNTQINKDESVEIEGIADDTTNSFYQSNSSATEFVNDEVSDTITVIEFAELSLSITRLNIEDRDKISALIRKDTVEIAAELGETIEGQHISVRSDFLTNLTVEQRYETSVTIMNEGPHCDLTEWKHFYSDWKQLSVNKNGQFICFKYNEEDKVLFPKISIDDLKREVKEQCGEEWFKLVEKVKTPNEYPCGVGISRYYLKVSGQRKDNNQTVTKLIIIELPMGC